jgi:hypothetical protein
MKDDEDTPATLYRVRYRVVHRMGTGDSASFHYSVFLRWDEVDTDEKLLAMLRKRHAPFEVHLETVNRNP